MWSFISQVEPPLLRLMLALSLVPALWFALALRVIADSAAAPVVARWRRRRGR